MSELDRLTAYANANGDVAALRLAADDTEKLRARVAELGAWAEKAEAVRVAAMRVVDFDLSDWKTRLDLLETAARACPPLESVTGKEAER